MILKYCSIIVTFCAFETSKDLIAGLDDEHAVSQKSVKFRPVLQNESHAGKRVSICLEWPEAYAAMREKEPSALPLWTRAPTPRYETPQYVQEYMNRGQHLNANQGRELKVQGRITQTLKAVRGLLPFKKTSTTHH